MTKLDNIQPTHPDPKTVEAELQDLIASYIIISTKDPLYVKEAKISARDEFASKVQTIIKSSNLELLERVEQDVIGRNEDDPDRNPRYQAYRNQLRDEQRQKLISLRKEYDHESSNRTTR